MAKRSSPTDTHLPLELFTKENPLTEYSTSTCIIINKWVDHLQQSATGFFALMLCNEEPSAPHNAPVKYHLIMYPQKEIAENIKNKVRDTSVPMTFIMPLTDSFTCLPAGNGTHFTFKRDIANAFLTYAPPHMSIDQKAYYEKKRSLLKEAIEAL